MFNEMADRMAVTIRVMYLYIDGFENKRFCPFYSELKGMEMALKTMGIEYEYEYNDDVTKITSVTVQGHTVTI